MVKSAQPPRAPHPAATGPMSMTGFASRSGAGHGHDWAWEIRAVNGKGLDLRLRLPEIEGLELAVRGAITARVSRGNLQVNLKLAQEGGADRLRLSAPALTAALSALREIEEAARLHGLELTPSRASDLLTLRGVIDQSGSDTADLAPLKAAILADLECLLADFTAMRAAEGAQLGGIIVAQIDRIAALTEAATELAEARRPEMAAALQAALARVLETSAGVDPARLAQELALLTVKADVTEELDRLRAHIAAARALLTESGPIGRKFEFLTQEFVRESNTLCSKSGSTALTAIGLDLKHVIDQMREQIQNVE